MATARSTFGRIFRRRKRGKQVAGYYVRVRSGKKEFTRWVGPDRRTAVAAVAELERRRAREELLGERAVQDLSIQAFLPQLRAHLERAHKATTREGERGRFDRIAKHFATRSMATIRRADVEEFLAGLRSARRRRTDATGDPKRVSDATRNRYVAAISVLFKLAIDRGYARANPTSGIGTVGEAKQPVPFISSTDVDRLVAAARDPALAALLRILADCGLRRSEASRLEWRDVHLSRPVVVVRESKTNRSREVPLTSRARAALETLHATRSASPREPDHVWPAFAGDRVARIGMLFRSVRRRAGFPRMRIHDLRHAFCSRLAQQGVPLPTIAALAGHLHLQTTMRYASHVPGGAAQEAILRLEET